MCGIAGLIDFSGKEVRQDVVKTMTDAIAHRGPDGEGHWTQNNVGLGHRRLAIIDLTEAASQPMISNDGRYVLTYNGEIYNYKEIQKELEFSGYRFKSHSDSEVLLAALIFWKESALLKLNGMFAFAFYDTFEKSMIIARDRYGIKPLYYSYQDGMFSFASEQKAIKRIPRFTSNFDKEGLLEYLTFQNFFSDKTLDNSIKILPAGHYLKIDAQKTSALSPRIYWDYNFSEPQGTYSLMEYEEELDRLFQIAVKNTLVGDVEVGTYLSGGVDSGSIAAIASQEIPGLKTFTIGFDLSSASGLELGFDERAKARLLSEHLNTEHFESVLISGDMEKSLNQLVYHLEEPRVGQSYPNLFAAKLARSQVKVVLSGAGGDELFGGYPWRYFPPEPVKNFTEFVNKYYAFWTRLVNEEELTRLLSPIKHEVSQVNTKEIFTKVFGSNNSQPNNPEDFLNLSLYFEARTFLHGLFVVEDKLSMSIGLETRVPFMDNDLVNFAMHIPAKLKIQNTSHSLKINENNFGKKKREYFEKTKDGKFLLRQVMQKYVNSEHTKYPKQGFSSPDASWFKGPSIDFVKASVLDKENQIFNYISYQETERILAEHFSGKKNRRLFIWSMLHLSELARNI